MNFDNRLLIVSIVFFIFAAALSVVIWTEVSLASRIGLFALGFGSGISAGIWYARRAASS